MTEWRTMIGDDRYLVSSDGKIQGPRKLLRVQRNHAGYARVRLGYKGRTVRVHRVVAEAFVPNPANLPEVNHKDGNKKNNSSSNLEWASRRDNMEHAFATGLCVAKSGEQSNRAILSEAQVSEIRAAYVYGSRSHGTTALGKKYGVSPSCIHLIIKRRNWS